MGAVRFRLDAKVLGRGFGYDIRGTDGPNGNLTRPLMYRLGRVLGSRLDIGSKVFVTGDARKSTPAFRASLTDGYMKGGVNVVVTPSFLPSGIAIWYVIQNRFDGSVVISGSHNPIGQNGAKITEKGKALYGKELASIEIPIREGSWRKNTPLGSLSEIDVFPQFKSMLQHVFEPFTYKQKILLDCADGIGGGIKEVLEDLGAEVIGINLRADGTFPTYGMANPSKLVCTDPLIAKIKMINEGITDPRLRFIGMMLDGDGDRVIFVTQDGVLFEPEKMAAIFYREYLRAVRAGRLPEIYGTHMALDVRATSSTTAMVSQEGGFGYYIQAGYPTHREWAASIIPEIRKEKITGTSAEASGHFFEPTAFYGPNGETYPEFAAALIDDGFFMGLRMLAIADSYGITLDQLMAEIPSNPFAPERRASIDANQKFEVAGQMLELLSRLFGSQLKPQKSEVIHFGNLRIQHPDNGLITVDGTKAIFPDNSSALVRASNTADELSFIFEAPTYNRLVEIMKGVISVLKPFEKTAKLDLAELVKQHEEIKANSQSLGAKMNKHA